MRVDPPTLVSLQDVRKTYRLRGGLWDRVRGRVKQVHAVDGVSLSIPRGAIVGLVGESGCGKSTLARMIVGLTPPTGGAILWDGTPLDVLTGELWRNYRSGVQMVFQDTQSSLNPRKRVRTVLGQALDARGVPHAMRPERINALLDQVGIDRIFLDRFPHELSGGQRQRIGIARALAMQPSLLVADEPVSSLDVSLQGQIINLLREINASLGLTIMLISHDLAVVARACDQVAVMYAGRIVEVGSPSKVLGTPAHPYTSALLDSVPRGLNRRARTVLPMETADISVGCRFQLRCPRVSRICHEVSPRLSPVGLDHMAACHLRQPTSEAQCVDATAG